VLSETDHLTADTLNGNDVVLVPGGSAWSVTNNPLSSSSKQDVLSFVESGHGSYGTCAGGFAASVDAIEGVQAGSPTPKNSKVPESYPYWRYRSQRVRYTMILLFRFMMWGKNNTTRSIYILSEWGGPTVLQGRVSTLTTFANDRTGHQVCVGDLH